MTSMSQDLTDPAEFAQTDFESDLDDFDDKLDEYFLEEDVIDPCEVMDVDDIGEQEVQRPYTEDVDEIMTQMDEVIDSREERPASELINAHHVSSEKP